MVRIIITMIIRPVPKRFITKPLNREEILYFLEYINRVPSKSPLNIFKGSSGPSHFIFEIIVCSGIDSKDKMAWVWTTLDENHFVAF